MAAPSSNPARSVIRTAAIWGLNNQITNAKGYYSNKVWAFDPARTMEQMVEFPSVNVFIDEEQCATAADVKLEGNEGLLHNSFILRFECFLNDVNSPALAQDRMLADIQKYFGTNYKIDNSEGTPTCHECYYDSSDPWGTDRTKPNVGITVNYRVWYRQKRTNPTQLG